MAGQATHLPAWPHPHTQTCPSVQFFLKKKAASPVLDDAGLVGGEEELDVINEPKGGRLLCVLLSCRAGWVERRRLESAREGARAWVDGPSRPRPQTLAWPARAEGVQTPGAFYFTCLFYMFLARTSNSAYR